MKENRDEPIGFIYIYIHTWKYHKKTPYIVTFILKKKNVIFFLFFFSLLEQVLGGELGEGEMVLVPVRRRKG
jgi:hypothetical protein